MCTSTGRSMSRRTNRGRVIHDIRMPARHRAGTGQPSPILRPLSSFVLAACRGATPFPPPPPCLALHLPLLARPRPPGHRPSTDSSAFLILTDREDPLCQIPAPPASKSTLSLHGASFCPSPHPPPSPCRLVHVDSCEAQKAYSTKDSDLGPAFFLSGTLQSGSGGPGAV